MGGLGLRTRATLSDAAIYLEMAGQHALRPLFVDCAGMMDDIGFEERCPPPNRERAGDGSGQRALERVLPRQLVEGEAQPPPPIPPPTAPHHRQPAWQPTRADLAMLAAVAAGDVDITDRPAAAGVVDKMMPDGPVMNLSSSCSSALDREAAASRSAHGSVRGEVAGSGGVASIDQLLAPNPVGVSSGTSQRSTAPPAAPLLAPARDGGEVIAGGDQLLHGGAATVSPTTTANGFLGSGSLPSSLGARDSRWGSNTASSPAAKALGMMTDVERSPITRYWGAEEVGDVEASPTQQGTGLTPLGLGGTRFRGGGDRSGGAGSRAESVSYGLGREDRLLRGSPLQGPYGPDSAQPQDCQGQDRHSPRRSTLPPADTLLNPPRFGRVEDTRTTKNDQR
eukprot:g6735.t1